MATTTNYGWTTPDDTALVKDGASAIRTLGTSVDTTTKNLNPSTTLGDIEYRSSTSNVNTRVGIGTSGQALTVVAGAPSWAASATSVLTTTGDSLYASAANTLARLGIGTTGQVLTVAAGLPSWATPASGGMTLISTTTLSGASTTISSIPQTYNHLQLVVRNFKSSVDGLSLELRINADATANRHKSDSAISMSGAFDVTEGIISDANDNSVSTGLIVCNIYDYTNTVTWKLFDSTSAMVNSTTTTSVNAGRRINAYNQIGAISSLLFKTNSGTCTGTVLLYGVK